jgi:tyrosyl-tRNA synthetase
MGRSAKDALDASSIIYPVMQAADIFMLGVDIAHAGTDQRKAHMLAREIAQKFSFKKPIAIHHSLLSGLLGPQKVENEDEVEIFSKMSKSKPESCIFIHDSEEEIKRKIKNAYCPPKVLDANPIIEICKYFILPQKPLYIKRDLKYGGDLQIDSFEALQKEYSNGNLHPLDLKKAVADELSEMLKPSREYFEKHKELLTQI